MYTWCSLLYTVIRRSAFRARLGSRLCSARREHISSTRVKGALNAGTSMYVTWAFQFYETLVRRLPNALNSNVPQAGTRRAIKNLIRSCSVCFKKCVWGVTQTYSTIVSEPESHATV